MSGSLPSDERIASEARINPARLATVVGVAWVLSVAQAIFLPLAIAMLITFALSPPVRVLRRVGIPMLATVLAVVAAAFAVLAGFTFLLITQLGLLAQNLPAFQANIITKVEGLKATGGANGLVARLSDMIAAINSRIGAALPSEDRPPLPVEVVQSSNALDFLESLVVPLISPVATAGLVVVVVIFMLLEREHLRDRFIRLVGSSDLHRTTQVLEEAGARVANYLLTQLLVNLIYAVPIGIGLYLIGVPNAPLWGLLTLVLRFVPYIGSLMAAAFPLFLAFAVSPGWSAVLWTAALFVVIELITSNIVEPWLYGSRTGVSPLAIIVAAIVWTFLWGPLGLVLSTPLTVCLVVLGRHIPQFAIFDILFGDEPVLVPHARLYQRLLAGDATEATFGAEEALDEMEVLDFYQDTVIPALLLAQDDRDRGVLNTDQENRLAEVAMTLVRDLAEDVADENPESEDGPPAGIGHRIAVVGGRTAIDDVAAVVLGQLIELEGASISVHPHNDLAPARIAGLAAAKPECLVLAFLDPNPTRTSLMHLRRIKRYIPSLRVGVVILEMPDALSNAKDEVRRVAPVNVAKLAEAEDLGADFAVTTLEGALLAAMERGPVKQVPDLVKPRARVKLRARPELVAQEGV